MKLEKEISRNRQISPDHGEMTRPNIGCPISASPLSLPFPRAIFKKFVSAAKEKKASGEPEKEKLPIRTYENLRYRVLKRSSKMLLKGDFSAIAKGD